METSYKNCQSCGMPLKRDAQGGGSNADGSKSTMYCSYCYQQGMFTQPSLRMDEMKALVRVKLKEMKIPGILAGIFIRNIPKLIRWKSAAH